MDVIILSIFPEHATQIYSGTKRAELRKSFSTESISLVFLYETSPVGAITGAMLLTGVSRLPLNEAISRAVSLGISKARAEKYFAGRESGWILEIGYAKKFSTPFTLREIQRINHYFRVPQVFAYLERHEGLSYLLLKSFWKASESNISLKPITKRDHDDFRENVLETVGSSYDEICHAFVDELLVPNFSEGAEFTTSDKLIKRISLGDVCLGYTTITLKKNLSMKTGPTVFLKSFRGMSLGTVVRSKIEQFAKRKGINTIYCTCPGNRPNVVAYLASSGMTIRAILVEHLGKGRNEYVLSKDLAPISNSLVKLPLPSVNSQPVGCVIEFTTETKRHAAQINRFLKQASSSCYFQLNADDLSRIHKATSNYQKQGRTAEFKPKRLFFSISDDEEILGVLLLTYKRSDMIKLNLYALSDDPSIASDLIGHVTKNIDARRFYMTLAVHFTKIAIELASHGFQFEGRIPHPFDPADHLCLGINRI